MIDDVWGQTAADALVSVLTRRADRGKPLTWIEVGSVGGATAATPSAALRSARLQLVGSGQGSVGTREYLAELPALAAAIADGTLRSTPGRSRCQGSNKRGPTRPPTASC